MQNNPAIILKSYELLKHFIAQVLRRIPRDQRFALGNQIQGHLTLVMELLTEAYYTAPAEKRPLLLKVNLKLEILRHYLRLCHELGYYDSAKLKHLSEQVDEIGRMAGAWLKSIK